MQKDMTFGSLKKPKRLILSKLESFEIVRHKVNKDSHPEALSQCN